MDTHGSQIFQFLQSNMSVHSMNKHDFESPYSHVYSYYEYTWRNTYVWDPKYYQEFVMLSVNIFVILRFLVFLLSFLNNLW